MKKSLSVIVLILCTLPPVFAKSHTTIQENWSTTLVQGVQESSVGARDKLLMIGCDVNSGNGHVVMLYPKGMANDQYDLSQKDIYYLFNNDPIHYTITEPAYNTPKDKWTKWAQKLFTAKTITIMQGQKQLAQFHPSQKSINTIGKKLLKQCDASHLKGAI